MAEKREEKRKEGKNSSGRRIETREEDEEDYNASYSKLAMIFNGGEIPSQQDMMRSD